MTTSLQWLTRPRGTLGLDSSALPALGGALLCAAWLAPNHYQPWLSYQGELMAAVAGAVLVLYAVVRAARATCTLPRPALVLLATALIPWAQWAVGVLPYRGDAVLCSAYLAGTALVFWAGFQSARDDDAGASRAVAWAMVWAAIASTGLGLYQWFGLTGLEIWAVEGAEGARVNANLAQANHLATLLVFGIAAALWLRRRGALHGAATAVLCAFLTIGLALTGSRTPVVGLAVLALWWLAPPRPAGVPGLSGRLCAVWAAGYALAFVAARTLPTLLLLQTMAPDGRLAVGTRPMIWAQMAAGLAASPWTGYGWQGGLAAQAAGAAQHAGLEPASYAHSLVLDLLVWNGAVLGGVLLLAGALWYLRIGRAVRARGGWFEFSVLTVLLGHALLEYPHAYTYFLVPVALLAGRLEALHGTVRWRCPLGAIVALALAVCAAMAAVVRDYPLMVADRASVMLHMAKVGGARTLPEPPALWVLDQYAAAQHWAREVPRADMSAHDIAQQADVARRFPSPFLMRQRILILALNGQPDAALAELYRLRNLHMAPAYQASVAQLRERVADAPRLAPLLQRIDAAEPHLPRLPSVYRVLNLPEPPTPAAPPAP